MALTWTGASVTGVLLGLPKLPAKLPPELPLPLLPLEAGEKGNLRDWPALSACRKISKPKRLFMVACALALSERPLGPSVWDQSKPVPLLAVLLMLRTLTWIEIWCFGRSTALRKLEILRIALSLSITTMVLTFGSKVTDPICDPWPV